MSADQLLQEWLAVDKNENNIKQLKQLRENGNTQELLALLDGPRISFGTSGLRARMAPGFSHMNDVTVVQTSQGVCDYLLREEDPAQAKSKGVIIGHDHRHNSERFARLSAKAFARQGVKVYLLKGISATPLVPFGIKKFGCSAGIMITASHNPKADNGYKLYWGNGVQIIGPRDADIAKTIVQPQNLKIDDAAWKTTDLDSSELIADQTAMLRKAYFEYVKSLVPDTSANEVSSLQLVYTAMHGVGTPFIESVFPSLKFPSTSLHVVPSQAQADPEFPTVKFPNPEEEGALNESFKYADSMDESKGRILVLANDPDVDRFTLAEKHKGAWRQFSGDQIGAMLGVWTFRQYKAAGKPLDKLAVLASTVSSKMLATVAKKEGFHFEETLTGFKFLGNSALALEAKGYNAEFAYEEAIGYACGNKIRDKDGISAFAVFTNMAACLEKEGKSISDYLDELYSLYGFHHTNNHYYICRSPPLTDRIFSQLRFQSDTPPPNATHKDLRLPETLAGLPLVFLRDLTVGYDSSKEDLKPSFPVSKSSHMISFTAGKDTDDVQVSGTIRTSGTEPKIKIYIEGRGEERQKVTETLERARAAIGDEWLKWKHHGLESS